jgi:hypothetical protein
MKEGGNDSYPTIKLRDIIPDDGDLNSHCLENLISDSLD